MYRQYCTVFVAKTSKMVSIIIMQHIYEHNIMSYVSLLYLSTYTRASYAYRAYQSSFFEN